MKYLFYLTLIMIKKLSDDNFSGIGLILYHNNYILSKFHADLRPSAKIPCNIKLGNRKTIQYLLKIANINNNLHDGFILFNSSGKLTHVAQYFCPPPIKGLIPNESYGVRYRVAQYGSFLKGVILTGTINHDKKIHCFENGRKYIPVDE